MIIQKRGERYRMWFAVQIIIFIALVSVSIILPKNLYYLLIVIGIIFTIFAVFANWLLVIQLFNILGSAGLGLKIIDYRDTFFKTSYKKLMRIGEDSNRFRIPEDSKMPMVTVICSAIIILLYFWKFNIIDGELVSDFITPFQWFRYYKFIDVLRYIMFVGDVLLLYFAYVHAKKNIELLVIPAMIKALHIIVFEVYFSIRTRYWGNITINSFLIISFIAIFVMVLLVISNRIKKKMPVVIGCLTPIGIAIILCVQQKFPFVYSDGIVDLSLLISFIAYCIGYAALVFALDNKPVKELY